MKILVTAGPTREYLDPVRFLSNPSTGKMGYAVARAARRRGHRVVLVSGPTALKPPAGVETVNIVTAEEMLKAVRRRFGWCDGVVMAAAVGDFRAVSPAKSKMKKGNGRGLTLRLAPTPDILAFLSRRKGKKWLVGFAAETENLEKNAAKKLAAKKLDMVIGNLVGGAGAGFGSDTNRVTVLTSHGKRYRLSKRSKNNVARWILEKIERDLQRR